MRWTCSTCGEVHEDLPLCWQIAAPWRALVPEDEFDARVDLTDDVCVIDEQVFFVRCHLEVPIAGHPEPLAWSVWCSFSQESFDRLIALWDDPAREGEGCFGWMSSDVPVYEDPSINLPADVDWRGPGLVPLVRLHDGDHPLIRDQRDGVDLARTREIAATLLHP